MATATALTFSNQSHTRRILTFHQSVKVGLCSSESGRTAPAVTILPLNNMPLQVRQLTTTCHDLQSTLPGKKETQIEAVLHFPQDIKLSWEQQAKHDRPLPQSPSEPERCIVPAWASYYYITRRKKLTNSGQLPGDPLPRTSCEDMIRRTAAAEGFPLLIPVHRYPRIPATSERNPTLCPHVAHTPWKMAACG